MNRVLVLDSVNEDLFVCGLCKSIFNCLDKYVDHKQTTCVFGDCQCPDPTNEAVTNEIVFSETPLETPPELGTTACNSIENIVIAVPQIDITLVPAPANDEYTCGICGMSFARKRDFQTHIKSHYVKPHQCLVCGRCFTQNSHLQRHILTHRVHPEILSENTPNCSKENILNYSCPYCPKMYSNHSHYRSHLTKHQALKKYKCIQGTCKALYDTLEALLHHVSCAHITQLYVCHVCFETFETLESIASHEIDHESEDTVKIKQYTCSQCNAAYSKPEELSMHLYTENHKKMCVHCKKIFPTDKRLRLHLQTHKNAKLFQCKICKKSFHMPKNLATHMLLHRPKEYKCPICKLLYTRSDILRRHMKTHSQNKFQCQYKDCQKEFSRKDKLKRHLSTHS